MKTVITFDEMYDTVLANFAHPFVLGGYEWPTVIHYVAAQKFIGQHEFEKIRMAKTIKEVQEIAVDFDEPKHIKNALLAQVYTHPKILQFMLDMKEIPSLHEQYAASMLPMCWSIIHDEFQRILILESEEHVSAEDLIERHKLAQELRKLPTDAFSKLRHLQPEVGCFNRCSFCSQSAGTRIWSLNLAGLKNVFSALKTVALEKAQQFKTADGTYYVDSAQPLTMQQHFHPQFTMPAHGLLGYARVSHRPGVIFPYLDNDISTYPFLKQYIQYAAEDLGVRVRLSTVGYSRHNSELQEMHELINEQHLNDVAGFRLSITPYTYGFQQLNSRESFKEDVANVLATYKPLIEHLKPGQRTGCVEFRFKPLLEDHLIFRELFDAYERHLMAVGPYALVSVKRAAPFKRSNVRVEEARQLYVEGESQRYTLIQSDRLRDVPTDELTMYVEQLLSEKQTQSYEVDVYLFENEDGIYYGVNPMMDNGGVMAKQFYPPTATRPSAGYIDSERYFLNALLAYKNQQGIEKRRAPFEQATWSDVANTVHLLMHRAERLGEYNAYAANYVKREIIPLVQMYAEALLTAGYAPRYFYLSTFTIDNGSICNLGEAYAEFKHLASRAHIPMTPQQEKSFGTEGALSVEGEKWRMSVAPYSH